MNRTQTKNSFKKNMPLSFIIPNCPITQLPIKNPVIDHEGNTYESDAIKEWLKLNNTSPITRNPLKQTNLTPNRALIQTIEAFNNSIKNTDSNKTFRTCSGCGKTISLSENYKGKKEPTCYNCRPWNCKSCTFLNVSGVNKCIMCQTNR